MLQSACMNKHLITAGILLVGLALIGLGWLAFGSVTMTHHKQVAVYLNTNQATAAFTSRSSTARNLIAEAGLSLSDGARLTINGIDIQADDDLPNLTAFVLQIHPVRQITLNVDGKTQIIRSSASSLEAALAEARIPLHAADLLEPPGSTLLDADLIASLRRARPVTITIGSEIVPAWSTGNTVGEVLADAGMALQGLDYSQPGPDDSLPQDGKINIVRVREQVALEQTALPYDSEQVYDDSLKLGESKIIQAGVPGAKVSQVRIRFENGLEVSRIVEGEWVAREPVNQKVAAGTNMELQTTTVDGITLQYWHSMNVYATSYSPCNLGVPGLCGYTTASGAPAGIGSIGVLRSWFNVLVGTRIYVPGYGYGTINDIGAGIPGKDWIDLGYDDANYVEWYHNVTIYFLPPAPATVPWVLQ